MTGETLPQSAELDIKISPAGLRLEPGQEGELLILLQNRGREAQAHTVEVSGLPGQWYQIDLDAQERILPGAEREVRLRVSVPSVAGFGHYNFQIVAKAGNAESTAACVLDVDSAEAPSTPSAVQPPPVLSLNPALLIWRGEGQERLSLRIANPGSDQQDYRVVLQGLERGWYSLTSPVRVAAGQSFETQISVHPPPDSRQQDYPFKVVVTSELAPSVSAETSGWLSLPARTATSEPAQARPAPVATRAASTGPAITPPDVTLSPRANFHFGQGAVSAQAMLTVHNRNNVAERLIVRLEGLPEDWYSLSSSEVRLDPGASTQVPLRLTPRTGPGFPAGDYEFRVRVGPANLPEVYGEAVGYISISGVSTFTASLAPAQAEGRKRTFKLTVSNTGDVPLSIAFEAADPEGRCKFKLPSPRQFDARQQATLPIVVGAKRFGLVGPPRHLISASKCCQRVAPRGRPVPTMHVLSIARSWVFACPSF